VPIFIGRGTLILRGEKAQWKVTGAAWRRFAALPSFGHTGFVAAAWPESFHIKNGGARDRVKVVL